jgi:hypothetical protein
MSDAGESPQDALEAMLDEQQRQEPGVAQAVATYEAVERAYFQAVAASPQPVVTTTYATTTTRR